MNSTVVFAFLHYESKIKWAFTIVSKFTFVVSRQARSLVELQFVFFYLQYITVLLTFKYFYLHLPGQALPHFPTLLKGLLPFFSLKIIFFI
jgi:hypothetical protein